MAATGRSRPRIVFDAENEQLCRFCGRVSEESPNEACQRVPIRDFRQKIHYLTLDDAKEFLTPAEIELAQTQGVQSLPDTDRVLNNDNTGRYVGRPCSSVSVLPIGPNPQNWKWFDAEDDGPLEHRRLILRPEELVKYHIDDGKQIETRCVHFSRFKSDGKEEAEGDTRAAVVRLNDPFSRLALSDRYDLKDHQTHLLRTWDLDVRRRELDEIDAFREGVRPRPPSAFLTDAEQRELRELKAHIEACQEVGPVRQQSLLKEARGLKRQIDERVFWLESCLERCCGDLVPYYDRPRLERRQLLERAQELGGAVEQRARAAALNDLKQRFYQPIRQTETGEIKASAETADHLLQTFDSSPSSPRHLLDLVLRLYDVGSRESEIMLNALLTKLNSPQRSHLGFVLVNYLLGKARDYPDSIDIRDSLLARMKTPTTTGIKRSLPGDTAMGSRTPRVSRPRPSPSIVPLTFDASHIGTEPA